MRDGPQWGKNQDKMNIDRKKLRRGWWKKVMVLAWVFQLANVCVMAQDGASGINQATSQVRSYFDAGCNLMYAIGAVLGLIGAVKVFSKWNSGEPDTNKVAAAWFGSCVFLVIVATVLKSFFGI